MRQRNPGPHTLTVPSIPADVEPGEVIDYPDLIGGFELVDTGEAPSAKAADTTAESAPDPELAAAADPDPEPDPPLTAGARRGGRTGKSPARVAAETPEEA